MFRPTSFQFAAAVRAVARHAAAVSPGCHKNAVTTVTDASRRVARITDAFARGRVNKSSQIAICQEHPAKFHRFQLLMHITSTHEHAHTLATSTDNKSLLLEKRLCSYLYFDIVAG